MSVKLNARSGTRGAVSTGLGSAEGQTLLVFHRRDNTDNPSAVLFTSWTSTATFVRVFYNASGVLDYDTGGGAQTPDTAPTHNSGTWGRYAITRSAIGTVKIYFWDSALTRTDVETGLFIGTGTPTAQRFGDSNTECAIGQYRYFRFWNRELSSTELDAEVASSTIVSTTTAKFNFALDNAADTTDLIGSGTNFNYAGTVIDSSEEPFTATAIPVFMSQYRRRR
jgi:hypothetical protein